MSSDRQVSDNPTVNGGTTASHALCSSSAGRATATVRRGSSRSLSSSSTLAPFSLLTFNDRPSHCYCRPSHCHNRLRLPFVIVLLLSGDYLIGLVSSSSPPLSLSSCKNSGKMVESSPTHMPLSTSRWNQGPARREGVASFVLDLVAAIRTDIAICQHPILLRLPPPRPTSHARAFHLGLHRIPVLSALIFA